VGRVVPAPLVERIESELHADFLIVMGQTETSPVSAMTRLDDSLDDKANTIGTAMPGVEPKIVDPATGATLHPGETGEYCTRGYHVMDDYFDLPDQTAEVIDAEGWLHSGDLCSMDPRGYCRVEGRLKDMIIRGGENVYPREIEERLFEHPAVSDVAVVGLPDDYWGEVVAAFVRAAPGRVPDQAELRAWVRSTLAPHKTPTQWFAVESFPLTGSGKIQKFKLVESWHDGDAIPLRSRPGSRGRRLTSGRSDVGRDAS
jgi:fatty-acyl-CoA synthase